MRGVDRASAEAVGQTSLRRSNLSLVLRRLRDQGPRSRARLATELGLTRSTASSLVAELAERGLVRAGSVERGGAGRPGTAVELDGHTVCGIGAEINVNHIATTALDLGGHVVAEHRLPLEAHRLEVTEVVERLVGLVRRTTDEIAHRGATPVGLTVGIAGLVDRTRESLVLAPNLGWRDVPVAALVRDRLQPTYPVLVDNEGNLAAIAEAIPGDPRRQDILTIFGEVGLGGGIVAGGRLLRGREGYAGEFGHMIVDPQGRRCGCGRTGCWEAVAGLRALLDLAADADDPVRDPARPLEDRLAEINRRADLGDTRTLAALEQVGGWLGLGVAMLANALNPAAIVLGGYFAEVGHHMRRAVTDQLEAGVVAPHAGGTTVELSTFGFTAAVRGGATTALDAVFADPTLVERRSATELGGIG
jgi:predicted NBD/HSP70 family sugar kinase